MGGLAEAGEGMTVSDRESQRQLALTQEIHHDVKQILREQQLTAIFGRRVADETLADTFEGKVANVLVYLHAEEFGFNGSRIAQEVGRRYKSLRLGLTQQKVSGVLATLRRVGLITPSKAYSDGWGKYGIAAFLRKQLPADLRPRLKKQLERIGRLQ